MTTPTWGDVRELLEPRVTPSVSLFMPTHRRGRDTAQDPLRLKNLLAQAQEQLRGLGLRGVEAEALLAPARDLVGDSGFWRHREDGLALFIAADWFRIHSVPVDLAEAVVVGARFHVRPLLPVLWPDMPFFILALSQRGARLLAGTRFTVRQVELQDVPDGMADVLSVVVTEKQLQAHVAARRGPSRAGGAVAFHGHGLGRDADDERLLEYFRAVDRGVAAEVRGDGAPLVLAAVEHLAHLYRAATNVDTVVGEAIAGSPDEIPDAELHRRAWPLVEPLAEREVNEQLASYPELVAKGGASHSLAAILRDAQQARVATLFTADDGVVWGKLDERSAKVRVHDQRRPADEDLLDRAAVETLRTGGLAIALPRARMPHEGPVAAILRY